MSYTNLTKKERDQIMTATTRSLSDLTNYFANGEVNWDLVDIDVFIACHPIDVGAHYDFWNRYVDCIREAQKV